LKRSLWCDRLTTHRRADRLYDDFRGSIRRQGRYFPPAVTARAVAAVSPVSAWPAIASLALGLLTAYFLAARFGAPSSRGRFASIDGLRGYLAFFVFLHHSAVWYFYLRTGVWTLPPSNLYTHFGHAGVMMFFMVTGFLFWSKLIDGRKTPIDWTRLFVSRVLRIAPLYFFALAVLIAAVIYLSGFRLRESPGSLLIELGHWVGFTTLGAPDLNGVPHTSLILASVTWTLPYEWFFYLSLPLFAVLFRMPAPKFWVVVGVAGVLGAFLCGRAGIGVISSFGAGIITAFLQRFKAVRSLASLNISSLVAIAALGLAVYGYASPFALRPLILISAAFAIIACGNSLFGLLVSPVSRVLGEISYSIYLLHGFLLFAVFTFVTGRGYAATLSAVQHWLIVVAASPLLILFCFVTFRFIEAPAMLSAPSVAARIARRLGKRGDTGSPANENRGL